MDYKQIQDLIKAVNKSNIGELTIQQGDFKISIKQKKENIQTFVNPAFPALAVNSPQSSAPTLPQTADSSKVTAHSTQKETATKEEANNYLVIKSPMIGTFYRRQSPDKPALVELGAEVAQGQVVCIIEAMKLFNEIESEVSGKIVKVLVEDASPVEFDQPLFWVEP